MRQDSGRGGEDYSYQIIYIWPTHHPQLLVILDLTKFNIYLGILSFLQHF